MCIYIYIYICIYGFLRGSQTPMSILRDLQERMMRRLSCMRRYPTVSFHNFKSQNFKLSVSNPKSKHVAYVSVLSPISNCQGIGRKNKHENLKTDRTRWSHWFRPLWTQSVLLVARIRINIFSVLPHIYIYIYILHTYIFYIYLFIYTEQAVRVRFSSDVDICSSSTGATCCLVLSIRHPAYSHVWSSVPHWDLCVASQTIMRSSMSTLREWPLVRHVA